MALQIAVEVAVMPSGIVRHYMPAHHQRACGPADPKRAFSPVDYKRACSPADLKRAFSSAEISRLLGIGLSKDASIASGKEAARVRQRGNEPA